MAMGAVGALRNVRAAARAAALVKDHTHHSILVGDQATRFAVDMGLPYSPLTTQPSAAVHRAWLQGDCQPNFRADVAPDAARACGPYRAAEAADVGEAQLRHSAAEGAAAGEAQLRHSAAEAAAGDDSGAAGAVSYTHLTLPTTPYV